MCLLLAFASPLAASAQAPAGATLRVTVVDPSGAVIVGARVLVTPSADGVVVETGTRGDATFTALEPGRYTIHVESPGFESSDERDVRLRAGENRREVKLKIARLARDGAGRPAIRASGRAIRAATHSRRCSTRLRSTSCGRPRRDGAGAPRHGRAGLGAAL